MSITYNELGGGSTQFYGSYKGMAVNGLCSLRGKEQGLNRFNVKMTVLYKTRKYEVSSNPIDMTIINISKAKDWVEKHLREIAKEEGLE